MEEIESVLSEFRQIKEFCPIDCKRLSSSVRVIKASVPQNAPSAMKLILFLHYLLPRCPGG